MSDFIAPVEGQAIPNLVLHSRGTQDGEAISYREFSEKEFRDALGRESNMRVIVAGIINYQDVFERWQSTKFCAAAFESAQPRVDKGDHSVGRVEWRLAHVLNEAT